MPVNIETTLKTLDLIADSATNTAMGTAVVKMLEPKAELATLEVLEKRIIILERILDNPKSELRFTKEGYISLQGEYLLLCKQIKGKQQ